MKALFAIAQNTFREAVRDRVLYAILGAGIAGLLFALTLGQLSLHQEARVVQDVGLANVSLFSVWTAIFLGSSLLYKEIERKTLYVILPKPISRTQFLLGKYVGVLLTVLVFVTLIASVLLWVLALQQGLSPALWAPCVVTLIALFGFGAWKRSSATWLLMPYSLLCLSAGVVFAHTTHVALTLPLAAAVLTLGEVAVVSAIALFFSSFSTPVLTGFFTFGVWLLGRSADDMASLHPPSTPEPLCSVLHVLARVVPNLDLFVPGRHAIETLGPMATLGYVINTLGYGALYVVLLMVGASVLFARRDLT